MVIRTIQLQYLIENWGIPKVEEFLKSRFSCQRNLDVENFLHTKAIRFEQAKTARTYLLISDTGQILAYFSLSFKEIQVRTTKSQLKILTGGFSTNEKLSVFLIGQIGKNDLVEPQSVKLNDILTEIFTQISFVQNVIGGRVIILECEDNKKIIDLYQKHGFKLIETVNDGHCLKTMYIVPKFK